MSMYSEIFEQPTVLHRLLIEQHSTIIEIAQKINKRNIDYVLLAARGTSDNVGRYAGYLWGARNRLPVALAMPSLFTLYQEPPRLKNSLVVGISQSGQSPDIVSVLKEGKKQGAATLAITNNESSPLAKTADYTINILAGEEKAVAATKTYTAQLLAVAMLSCALIEDQKSTNEIDHVADWVEEVLKQDKLIQEKVQRYRYMERCVVLGRGYNYASAFEWALKLKELSFITSEPYSMADFKHGPIAVINKGFPVMVIAPKGKTFPSTYESVKYIKEVLSAEIITISNDRNLLSISDTQISIPSNIPEWLSPIPAIIAGQLFAYHLTCEKGLDPEKPRTIQKVTETY
ncbi:MAG: SIS domain-containing protein [Chloroflexi bacterium]|nr:SIS domain-containing protein [Chloroflexota bacterium]